MLQRALLPSIRVVGEGFALRVHDTEAVSAGGFHDPPAWELLHSPCAELLETLHLSLDIVGLDVDVYATRVTNLLQQYRDFTVRRPQPDVVLLRRIIGVLRGTSQRFTPEIFCPTQVIGLTIDDDGSKSAFVNSIKLPYSK